MSSKGFTIVELLLSVTIIGIIGGITIPLYMSFQQRNDLSLTTETTANMIRRAQTYARSGKNDSDWGVRFDDTAVTLFRGSSYAGRDTAFDELLEVPAGSDLSGLAETYFSKVTGNANGVGTITLTSAQNESKEITIDVRGKISF